MWKPSRIMWPETWIIERSQVKAAGANFNHDVPAVSPFELDCVGASDLQEWCDWQGLRECFCKAGITCLNIFDKFKIWGQVHLLSPKRHSVQCPVQTIESYVRYFIWRCLKRYLIIFSHQIGVRQLHHRSHGESWSWQCYEQSLWNFGQSKWMDMDPQAMSGLLIHVVG